jgi:hypothetical protein
VDFVTKNGEKSNRGFTVHDFNNFGGVGRAPCEACSAERNLSTNSAFALGSRKTMGNFDRVDLLIIYSQSQSYVTTDGQSASMSWCQAQIFVTVRHLRVG